MAPCLKERRRPPWRIPLVIGRTVTLTLFLSLCSLHLMVVRAGSCGSIPKRMRDGFLHVQNMELLHNFALVERPVTSHRHCRRHCAGRSYRFTKIYSLCECATGPVDIATLHYDVTTLHNTTLYIIECQLPEGCPGVYNSTTLPYGYLLFSGTMFPSSFPYSFVRSLSAWDCSTNFCNYGPFAYRPKDKQCGCLSASVNLAEARPDASINTYVQRCVSVKEGEEGEEGREGAEEGRGLGEGEREREKNRQAKIQALKASSTRETSTAEETLSTTKESTPEEGSKKDSESEEYYRRRS